MIVMTDPSPPLPPSGEQLRSILQAAGNVALARLGRARILARKADNSVVTDADVAAERELIAGIQRGWPGEHILSEEMGAVAGDTTHRWYVDPIDGTSAFEEGLAHWGPTVGRVSNAGVDLGGFWMPRLGEHYHFQAVPDVEAGRTWFNGMLLPTLVRERCQRVVYLPSRFHQHFTLDFRGKGRCLGGTAAHLALVARGAALGAIVAPGWSAWDVAAGLAMIRSVGGVVRAFPDGAPVRLEEDAGVPFAAGLPEWVEDLLSQHRVRPREVG